MNYRIRDLHEVAAGLMLTVYESPVRRFGVRVLAGRGRAEIHLPDGADIFVDPITVTAKTRFVETALTAEQAIAWPSFLGNRLAVTAEAGHRYTRSEVSLRSALIRRDDSGTDKQTFAGAGVRVTLGARRATRLDIGLRTLRGTASIARFGIERQF